MFNIRLKIVLPYTFLFSIVIIVISFINLRITYRRIDERIEEQIDREADVISSMDFILSDDFLHNIRISEVTGADVIIYRPNGEVIATTLPRNELNELMQIITISKVDYPIIQNISYKNHPYKIAYRRYKELYTDQYAILTLMASIEDINQAKKQSAITIGLVAVSAIIMITIIGSIIAINITAPVKKLLYATERLSAGDLNAEVKVKTKDEIGLLARSFDQMTKELKLSRDKLIQSEKLAAVGKLSAGIAHEIRNPLTSMKMIIQLLRKKVQHDESAKESVQIILNEIDRLELIVSGFLDFAKPLELTLKPTNLTDVISEVIGLMQDNLRHRKINLVEKFDDDIPEIMLDENRMKQVFMNIILNSMQAMPNGGDIIIKCGYNQTEQKIYIEISDTGIGMSQSVLDHVFEPFFSSKPNGTGMGLANVKKIIDLHNGNIKIESIEGKGTKVIILFSKQENQFETS